MLTIKLQQQQQKRFCGSNHLNLSCILSEILYKKNSKIIISEPMSSSKRKDRADILAQRMSCEAWCFWSRNHRQQYKRKTLYRGSVQWISVLQTIYFLKTRELYTREFLHICPEISTAQYTLNLSDFPANGMWVAWSPFLTCRLMCSFLAMFGSVWIVGFFLSIPNTW